MESTAVILGAASPRAIEWTAERLVDGGVVAMPTDTVYGLAASLSSPTALRRLYDVKKRSSSKPLAVLLSSSFALEHLVPALPDDLPSLLDEYWPGPLSVVLECPPGIPPEVRAADGTIAVRVPNHPLAIEVIEKAGGMIACTSANLSGCEPARDARTVHDILGSQIDLILDGGIAPLGTASTIVALRGDKIVSLREGAIPFRDVAAFWDGVVALRG